MGPSAFGMKPSSKAPKEREQLWPQLEAGGACQQRHPAAAAVYEGPLTAEPLTPGHAHGHSSPLGIDRGAKEEAGGTYERCQHPIPMCQARQQQAEQDSQGQRVVEPPVYNKQQCRQPPGSAETDAGPGPQSTCAKQASFVVPTETASPDPIEASSWEATRRRAAGQRTGGSCQQQAEATCRRSRASGK